MTSTKLQYDLPSTVKSIRDGWQWTSTSGAVVSGLLASAAAQLLGFFKGDDNLTSRSPQDRNLVLVLCYAALFLNISATISSFILTDNLGEIEYKAAQNPDQLTCERITIKADDLLVVYGASSQWKCMLIHWLVTFYLGILALIMSVLSFVWLSETREISITMTVLVVLTLGPLTHFIIIRPFVDKL